MPVYAHFCDGYDYWFKELNTVFTLQQNSIISFEIDQPNRNF